MNSYMLYIMLVIFVCFLEYPACGSTVTISGQDKLQLQFQKKTVSPYSASRITAEIMKWLL